MKCKGPFWAGPGLFYFLIFEMSSEGAGLWLSLVQRGKTLINKFVSWFGLGWDLNGISVLTNWCTSRTWKDWQRSVVTFSDGWQRNEVLQRKSCYKFMSVDLLNSLCWMCIYLNVGLMSACQIVYSCPVQAHLLLSSLVEFHPDISRLQLFSSSIDYKIRIWDLNSSKCVAMLDGHFSAVTSLAFADGNTLIR